MKANDVSQATLLNQLRQLTSTTKINPSWKIPVADYFMPEELIVIKCTMPGNNDSGAVCETVSAF